MPRQILPKGLERDYASALLAMVETIEKELAPLLEELPNLSARAIAERADVGEGRRIRDLIDAARARLGDAFSSEAIERLADRFATQTATSQRIQMNRQLRAVLGADVLGSDRGIAAVLDSFSSENVALIKDVPVKIVGDLERLTTRAIASATPHATLAQEIEKVFRTGRNRARLIARDQVGKLYGQINHARQQNLGVTHFIWRTANDERVRDEHQDREGQRYAYSSPPDGELPGQPVNCRCYAEPDLTEILGES